MQLSAEARAGAVDVEGGRLDLQRRGDAAGLRRDGHLGAAPAGDDHADVLRLEPRALERQGRRAPGRLDVRVHRGLLPRADVGVAGRPDVVEREDRAPLADADALEDPLVARADVELLEEAVVDDVLGVEVAERVKIEGLHELQPATCSPPSARTMVPLIQRASSVQSR